MLVDVELVSPCDGGVEVFALFSEGKMAALVASSDVELVVLVSWKGNEVVADKSVMCTKRHAYIL